MTLLISIVVTEPTSLTDNEVSSILNIQNAFELTLWLHSSAFLEPLRSVSRLKGSGAVIGFALFGGRCIVSWSGSGAA